MQITKSILATLFAALAASASFAHEGQDHAKKAGPVRKEQKPWGIAGDANAVKLTIEHSAKDSMRFTPDSARVKLGDTVRFIVRNEGKVMHEFVIGTKNENAAHAELMKKFPTMEHAEPYMAHLPPGKTAEIVWTFNRPGQFEFACLIAGHYEAGMKGTITVASRERATSAAPADLKPVAQFAQATVAPVSAADMTEGEVRKVDVDAGKVTLKHGEIKNLDMPAMTMVFVVKDKTMLGTVKAGDKVKFKAVNEGGKITLTEMQVLK